MSSVRQRIVIGRAYSLGLETALWKAEGDSENGTRCVARLQAAASSELVLGELQGLSRALYAVDLVSELVPMSHPLYSNRLETASKLLEYNDDDGFVRDVKSRPEYISYALEALRDSKLEPESVELLTSICSELEMGRVNVVGLRSLQRRLKGAAKGAERSESYV